MPKAELASTKEIDRASPSKSPAIDPESGGSPGLREAERRHMIAEAAYYRAERRGFEPGLDEEDWLEAEREIDRLPK